jgi:putative spermidine/putrescine transport system permease protein
MLSPALFVVLLLFAVGLAFSVVQSFDYFPIIGKNTFDFEAYKQAWSDLAFRAGLLLSFEIAFSATLLSAALAVACAMLLRATRRGRSVFTFIFQLNLPIPHIVGAVAMLLLLSQSGLVSRLTHAVGLTGQPDTFPPIVADRWGLAIIAEYVWKEVPFIGTVVLAALASGIEDYESVARTLGAGGWQRFRHVVLPMITPAVLSTSIIVFAFTFGAYEVPFLLGRPFPAPLPVLAFHAYTDIDLGARSEAMAIMVVIAVIVTVLVLQYMRLSNRYLRAAR